MTPEPDPAEARRAAFLHRLLYETPGGRRFTQDSPILTNVWMAYAREPRSQQKLILTLERHERAGQAAQELRRMLAQMRSRIAEDDGESAGYRLREPIGKRERPRIAYIPGQISAELYFDEMMRLVLPLTPWWRQTLKQIDRACRTAKNGEISDWRSFPLQTDGQLRDIKDGLALMRRETLAEKGMEDDETEGMSQSRKKFLRRLPVELFWMIRLAGTINDAFSRDRSLDIPVLGVEELEGLPAAAARTLRIEELIAREFRRREEMARRRSSSQKPPHFGDTGDELDMLRAKTATSFRHLYRHWTRVKDEKTGEVFQPKRGMIWRVALNRPVELAVRKSRLTVKADAARTLFNISCRDITWAVIDSGIDAKHPAFRDSVDPEFDESLRGLTDEDDAPPLDGLRTRVDGALDFTYLRELLDTEVVALGSDGAVSDENQESEIADAKSAIDEETQAELKTDHDELRKVLRRRFANDDNPERAVKRHLDRLRERINSGSDISWEDLDPLIRYDEHPDEPKNDHGTHVAGILGGDWIDDDLHAERLLPLARRTRKLQGICPDIRLLDVRVFREDGKTDEFELLAAVQFLRWMNSRAGYTVVHGANLSLSLIHEVRRYACGQTPICEECNEAAETGMVIVAAAGNRGFESEDPENVTMADGYRDASITDPGNAEKVITVGATHRKRPHDYGVSFFSSRGPTGDGRQKPDLVAPGEKIRGPTPDEGLEYKDGTSMAAPHVSGAAAMLMARHSELIGRPARIKEILCSTATDLGRERYFQGCGLLDILRALQSV